MADNLNFQTVRNESIKYFQIVSTHEMSEDKMAEFGFYFLALSQFIQTDSPKDLLSYITDGEFNKNVLGTDQYDDRGVDALWIDEEEKIIHIFNFKHSTKPGHGSIQINALKNTLSFVAHLRNSDDFEDPNKTEELGNEAMDRMRNDAYEINIHFVTNLYRERVNPAYAEKKARQIKKEKNDIKNLEKSYDVKINEHFLNDLASFIYDSGEKIDAKINLAKGTVLKHAVDEMSNQYSYLASIPLNELVRITCNIADVRSDVDFEIIDSDEVLIISPNILFDNVREYLGPKNQFNSNMMVSLSESPEQFFYFNNGITIVAESVEHKSLKNQDQLILKGIQVVNGGQTLKTIYKYYEENVDPVNLTKAQVLVRVLRAPGEMKYKVAEYTNSQSKINDSDLKSIDKIQREIEQLLRTEGYTYLRKRGEFSRSVGKGTISKETLAQILFAVSGSPHAVSNSKRKLFTDYYDSIFNEDKLKNNRLKILVEKYFEVSEAYRSLKNINSHIKKSQQKIFYVMFMAENPKIRQRSVDKLIILLEEAIKSYRSHESITDSRKLYQKEFINHLIEYSNSNEGQVADASSLSEGASGLNPLSSIFNSQIRELNFKQQKNMAHWGIEYKGSRVGFLRFNKSAKNYSMNIGVTSVTIQDFDFQSFKDEADGLDLICSIKSSDYENLQFFELGLLNGDQIQFFQRLFDTVNTIRNNR